MAREREGEGEGEGEGVGEQNSRESEFQRAVLDYNFPQASMQSQGVTLVEGRGPGFPLGFPLPRSIK